MLQIRISFLPQQSEIDLINTFSRSNNFQLTFPLWTAKNPFKILSDSVKDKLWKKLPKKTVLILRVLSWKWIIIINKDHSLNFLSNYSWFTFIHLQKYHWLLKEYKDEWEYILLQKLNTKNWNYNARLIYKLIIDTIIFVMNLRSHLFEFESMISSEWKIIISKLTIDTCIMMCY